MVSFEHGYLNKSWGILLCMQLLTDRVCNAVGKLFMNAETSVVTGDFKLCLLFDRYDDSLYVTSYESANVLSGDLS